LVILVVSRFAASQHVNDAACRLNVAIQYARIV